MGDDVVNNLIITKFVFDQYWVGANAMRIDCLMAHEIDALVDYHWRLLLKEAKRKEEQDETRP